MTPTAAGAVSGALAAAALPPFGLWPLGFVALVPLALAVSSPGVTREQTVTAGLGFGAVFYGALLHWVPFTTAGLIPFGAIFGLLSIVVLASIGALQTLLLRHLLNHRSVTFLSAIPAVWVSTEMGLEYAGPLAFPWAPLGLSLAAVPAIGGSAAWVGVHGLTLWIGLVNGGVAETLRSSSLARRYAVAGLTLALAIVPAAVGLMEVRALEVEALPPVLATQISVSREELMTTSLRDQRVSDALEGVLIDAIDLGVAGPEPRGEAARIAILPEAPFGNAWDEGVADRIAGFAERLGVPVLVGAHVRSEPPAAPSRPRNALLLVEPGETGRVVHGKTRLVPGVERPGLLPGSRGPVLRLDGLSLGLVICFESAFGRDVRRLRSEGADLLVNATNDGWFRPGLPGIGSAAHRQHRAHLVLRAMETRMGAVRSSVGGELLAIAPDGSIDTIRPVGEEGVAMIRPAVSPDSTIYVRFGDLGGLAGLVLLGVLSLRRRPTREDSG